MPKFHKILWSLAILFFMVTILAVSFGLLLVGAAGLGMFGLYRYYLTKKRVREFSKRSHGSGEIVDLKPR